MRPRPVDRLDPELEPFTELTAAGSRAKVIIEGELAVSRALAGGWPVETVVTTPGRRDAMRGRIRAPVQWLEVEAEALKAVTGFEFHRGVLAAGRRPLPRVAPPPDVLRALADRPRPTVVLAENLADPSNLGALVRNAAALGADLVVVTGRGADPFSRRAIRASAGHVLDHPVIVTPDPAATVAAFAESLPGSRILAATLSPDATALAQLRCPGPALLMFGNEGEGLSGALVAAADEQVRIEMMPGVDSLNVAAASAVMLWARQMVASGA